VNEVVDGEGGIRLLRSTMEAATPDYMRWGAVREMHQPSAVGTALGVDWDERGAFFRCKVVDDAAWAKVQAGVYKGFSVGVLPRVMRGNQVTQATWAETSLVDRPKDPDAAFSVFRAEGFDAEAEVEVVEEAEPLSEGDFEARMEQALEPILAQLQRLEAMSGELVTRAEAAEAALATAQETIQRLEHSPARLGPVRYPSALERDFPANAGADTAETTALKNELKRLAEATPKEPDEQQRFANVQRMQVIQMQLREVA